MEFPLSDTELVQRTLGGDQRAFDLIVARYQKSVASVARRACSNFAQSEDICQDTFVSAWRNMDKLKDPSKLKSWLCSIARYRAKDATRKRREVLTEDGTMEEPQTVEEDSPLRNTINLEERQTLLLALHGLPPNYRDPLILYFERGATTKQIAATLELSVDAVKQRMKRGKALLKLASLKVAQCGSGAETAMISISPYDYDGTITAPL